MVTRLRKALDGTGPYTGFAAAALLVAVIFLGSILLTPHGWQWWVDAKTVPGHEEGGLVYYSFQGSRYTISDPDPNSTASGPRTVYVIAADPSSGRLSNDGTVILDWSLTAGPAAIGVGLAVTGFAKRRSRRRPRTPVADDTFGRGLPSEVVRHITATNQPRATD